MGVVLWYQIEFPKLGIRLSSDPYSGNYLVDAEISVRYEIGQPGTFEVKFKDLPVKVSQAVRAALGSGTGADGGVPITIRLGYLDEPGSQAVVLAGRVDGMHATTRFPPLGSLLTGYEEAAFKLVHLVDISGKRPKAQIAHVTDKDKSYRDIARYVAERAKVPMVGATAPAGTPKQPVTADAENAFDLLGALAKRADMEVLVQENGVQFGPAVTYPPDSGLPVSPDPGKVLALITGEDRLIAVKNLDSARLAEFKPIVLRSAARRRLVTGLPAQADVQAYDFTVLGTPTMRAGQLVIATVEGYENASKPFRILELTHTFSPESGYRCSGRAVEFTSTASNRKLSEQARRASSVSVADRLAGKIRAAAISSPSVDVGRVTAAKPADRVANLAYREDESPVSSPSVDQDIPDDSAELLGKPVSSPFAWHRVGLSVPVYQGMRALLNQVRDDREDSVVTGFLWANEGPRMDRPQAREGDWWLCLPTELSGSPQLPTGKGVNDLTAADGRRVVETAGLRIVVGKSSCSDVGSRPAEGPADTLVISHKSGTSVQIDDGGTVTVDGGRNQVVLKAGGVTLTIGNGKVAIS